MGLAPESEAPHSRVGGTTAGPAGASSPQEGPYPLGKALTHMGGRGSVCKGEEGSASGNGVMLTPLRVGVRVKAGKGSGDRPVVLSPVPLGNPLQMGTAQRES